MTKIKMLAAAVAVASVSTITMANPPLAPSKYDNGPLSPSLNTTNLSEQERIAYALLEGMMQSAEGYVHANGCPATKLELPLSVYSDSLGSPKVGDASLGTSPNILKLVAATNAATFMGQQVNVKDDNPPLPAAQTPYFINGKLTGNFASMMTYNSANNMMVGQMKVDTLGINGQLNSFTGYVIKDFYKGEDKSANPAPDNENELFLIIDWGLQSLSKEDYPVEKYWQRSKVRRSDGGQAKTVFVKDRLVGVTPCRITVALAGLNGPGLVQQSGKMIIENVTPITTSNELQNLVSPLVGP